MRQSTIVSIRKRVCRGVSIAVVALGACLASVRPAAADCGGTPNITTDKGDYAPTETVTLSGTGFGCREMLSVLITAPDGSTFSGDGTGAAGPDAILTDGDGTFTLAYRLSGALPDGGRYEGQFGRYRVDVLDGAGTVLATTTFSDGQGYYSCAITSGGGVKCWGSNWAGQLGDGTQVNRLTPTDVAGLASGVVQVSTGYDHACALLTGGSVKCWGANSVGQLGDGTVTRRATATDVVGLTSGVVQISAGFYSTCAVMAVGTVKCWGFNISGQLGDGTVTNRHAPVEVSGLITGATQVSIGYMYACAVTTTGGVKCWGAGGNGQLGDGSTVSRLTPVDVAGLATGIEQVRAGGYHTCALSTNGGVKCWGANWIGQLGDGSFMFRAQPVSVAGFTSGAAELTLGWEHGCALTTAGGVKCWGSNWAGSLGDGTGLFRAIPIDVAGLTTGVEHVRAGGYHTCAVVSAGALCWGANGDGQVGDGSRASRFTPVQVIGLTGGVADLWDGGASAAADSTPPTAVATQSPAANAAGWNNTDVTITWSWADNAGGTGIDPAHCHTTTTASEEGNPLAVSATCRDLAGNLGTAAYAVNIDKTAPLISAAASSAANAAGWYNSGVIVTFTCSDARSGVATCPAEQTLSAEGAAVSSAAQTAVDFAGNTSLPSQVVTVKIDRTAPVVSLIGGPMAGAVFDFGAVPSVPACSASDALSGIDGECTVTGYSTLVGSHTVTATARDRAGNQASTSVSYTVRPWILSGLYQPIDMGEVWNTVKSGSTIPIKFEVFAGGVELTDTAVVRALTAAQSVCTGGPTDEIELLAPETTSLRYDTAAGQFIYNWQTPRNPGFCYVATLTLRDGTSRSARIQLR